MLERGSGSWDIEDYPFFTANPYQQQSQQSIQNFPLYGMNNNVGMLTFPNAFYPAFVLDYTNLTGVNDALYSGDIVDDGEIHSAQFPYIPQIPIIPDTPQGLIDKALEWKGTLDEFFKKFYIALFALALVVAGLYFLAKSTDTGKAALNLATKI